MLLQRGSGRVTQNFREDPRMDEAMKLHKRVAVIHSLDLGIWKKGGFLPRQPNYPQMDSECHEVGITRPFFEVFGVV